MTGSVRPLATGSGVAAAEVGPVCVVLWRGAVTPESFALQSAALSEVVGRHPEGAGFLCVIEPTARPPDDELRRRSAEMITSHGKKLRCVATVVEGSGLKASITRAVLSGISLLARDRTTTADYFADARAGASWMTEYVKLPSVDVVLRALEDLRRSLPAA